jgi:hypothetical protein
MSSDAQIGGGLQSPVASRKSPIPATGWAAFLAASWTWCIGMFLPVLLVRDFGAWGWFVFAIPNVIGAAAMGWTIASRDHSLRLVTQHREATAAFSYVTVAFHLFFVLWLFSQLLGTLWAALAFGLLLLVLLPVFVTNLAVTSIALVVLGVSVAAVVISAGAGALAWPDSPRSGVQPFDVFALFFVCVLGFVCCPYLDLTFHRARQECAESEQARAAFGVGFGMFFLAMIVFTLFYAKGFIDQSIWTSPVTKWVIALHILVQAMFTVGVHADALAGSTSTERGHTMRYTLLWMTILVAVLAAVVALALDAYNWTYHGHPGGEIVYRLFMAFYGLIAPAYIWLCVWPGRGYVRPDARTWLVFGLACAIASPFYWFAFMAQKMPLALIGIAVLGAARFLLDNQRRDRLGEARSTMPLGSYNPQRPED